MSFSLENGYTPLSVEALMDLVRVNVNTQFGTSYITEDFIGTNYYKFFYALIQKLQENEVKTSEIFLKLQQYFDITNEKIVRPVVTNPGLIEIFQKNGFVASVKPIGNTEAGKLFVCVDTDELATDYATKKLAINTIIKDSSVAGAVSQGTEVSTIVLTNGQSFDFKFKLPNRIEITLRLTITLSENNQLAIADPDDIKLLLLNNIAARYRLGRNFEPERYFGVNDAPWASTVLLEWSNDGGSTYASTVFTANYDDLFELDLARVHLVEE